LSCAATWASPSRNSCASSKRIHALTSSSAWARVTRRRCARKPKACSTRRDRRWLKVKLWQAPIASPSRSVCDCTAKPITAPTAGRASTGRVCYKAEVTRLGDNPRFVVTSITNACPETVYRDLYCARGQDENYIKQLKNDLVCDRMAEQGFVGNHLRLFYACAAYELIHALRMNTLKGTSLERAQPATLRHKLFKLAVRVVEHTDRIKLHLPTACPVAGLLRRVTEIFYRTPRLKPG